MTKVFSTRLLKQSATHKALTHGIKITEASFIHIVPVLSEALKQNILKQLNRPDQTLLFTSKNAAAIVLDNYLEGIPEKVIATWKCYCLSGATKKRLSTRFAPSRILAAADHAKGLIDKISATKHTTPIHFFCGNRRRPTLPDFMRQNNIAYKEWIVYNTEASPKRVQDHYAGYLFYSPSAVESFFSKNTLSKDKPCFAIGATTAAAIQETISNPVYISEKPDTDHMLQLLCRYYKTKK